MDQRYNYFHQNPNPLVNGQSTFNRSTDSTQPTNNYSGSISSPSSRNESPFHERKHISSNEIPLMNSHLYRMNPSNQPPRSSGPPRTNIKGIYENSHSSVPNAASLAQTNTENYPINPDYQLQPHLTGLLPQQSKRVPELYQVDKYSTSKESIATNMDTNYFSTNKLYPEPKIIEYDIEETSTTESSPQHTSSLYSESTDQDSESIHQSNLFTRHTLPKNTEYHITKESKTITSSNEKFPVPTEFADLSLNRDDGNIDDNQHSILNSAYDHDNKDIIEDIPLSDNINQNEIDSNLENQENPESQINEQSLNMSKVQTFDYYAKKKDFSQTEFNYENIQDSSTIFDNKNNYFPYNINNSSNIQNSSQFNKGSYFNQLNTQASLLNSSISQQQQSKPLFSYSNTELLSHQQESLSTQNYIKPVFENSNVLPIDSKLQSNVINSNIQDEIISNQFVTQAQTSNNQNSLQEINSIASNQHYMQSISQQVMHSPSKSPVSEMLNNNLLISHGTSNSSLMPVSSITSTVTASPTSFISKDIVQENQNIPYTSNDQASQLSNTLNKSPIDFAIQNPKNSVKFEFESKLSQPSSNLLVDHQQEITIDQSKCIDNQSNKCQYENVNSSMTPIRHNQHEHFLNKMNTTPIQSNYQQPQVNQIATQSSATNDMKMSNNQFSNDSINVSYHSIKNQSVIEQKSTATSHSVSQYFNSEDPSSQILFNKQSLNIQLQNQHENVQNIKPISNFSSLEKSNNFMTFPNVEETTGNVSKSSNQQHPTIKKELETNESIKLDSNILPKEIDTLNSKISHLAESVNNLNVKSLENTEVLTGNRTNVKIENNQNIPINKSFDQEQKFSSYFTKENLVDQENSIEFSSTVQSIGNSVPKLLDTENTTQPLINNQTNSLPSNSDQQNLLLSINQSSPVEKLINQPISNEFASQGFSDKSTSHSIPFVSTASNQLPPQMFNNQLTSDTIQPLQSTSNLYATQSFNNQNNSTIALPVSTASNQLPSQMLSNQSESDAQLISSPYSMQHLNNLQTPVTASPVSIASNQLPRNHPKSETIQPLHSTQLFNNQQTSNKTLPVSIASNQLPPQMFINQPKCDTIQPLQSTSQYSIPPFNNQHTPNTTLPVSTVSNAIPTQLFSNQPKSNTMSYLSSATNLNQLSKPFNNQSIPNTVLPVPSANQFSPSMFNDQSKSKSIPPFQPTKITQQFNNQSTQIIPPIASVTNQLPPQAFGNPSNSGITPSQQVVSSQYQVQSLNNQPMSDAVPVLPSISSQNSSQPFNNQPRSMFPPPPALVNQLPSQILNNQIKSDVTPSLQSASRQYPLHQFNNQPRSNTIPQVSSTVNNFPPTMFNNQPRLDNNLPNKPIINQYPSQPLSSQPVLSNSSIQQVTNQHSSQPLNVQSKTNTFSHSQSITNQHPSHPFNNLPGQQVIPKPSTNSFYNPTNSIQPVHNQWPPHQSMNQLNQQSSNLTNLPSNVNQQTQMLPPNPSYSNNYYNQMQGNAQQSQPSVIPPGQNGSKGYPQQSNISFSNQINYQQPNAIYGQQGSHNQQQNQFRPEQNSSVVQQGFSKTWGYDNLDLLKSRDILPGEGIQPPEIKLPQGYANCDNCSPDVFRCTLNKFPSSKNLLDKCRLPLGILIHPYKDLSRLTVIQCETITRCRNCRSYINPFVQFIDNAHWKCNLCYRVNELPGEFQIDPYTKTLGDPSRRPEIQNATIEYIASQDYMVRPPQPALYLFLLDVSRTATLNGYLEIVCDRILNKIMSDDIPGDSRTNIGFITYDSSVHFYQIANCEGGQPKQLVVSDISDIFLPLPEGLMVNLEENKSAIKDLLISLPNHYRESYNTGCALGAALQAAFKILAPRGGRVTVFQACLPNFGPGNLQCRDDGNPHTGDRVQHMAPSTDFYKKLALECSAEQIAVDMFFVSSQYLDIATLSGISKYSAGCIHNFPQFNVKSPTIVTRFINCFDRYLSRKIGFEALLRLRCTRGVAIHSFHGNFFVRSSDLLMLPNVNPDNAYGMQLSIEDSLDGISVVCFQAALLYTSSNAERRIRVHTLCIPVTDNINDVFHNADQQAITGLIAKMAVDTSTEKSLSDAREAFFNAISDSLSAFKLGCSSYNGPGTMLTPLSLKMFPLYILATLKHMAFRTNQATRLDERMFSMCQMKSLPLNSLIQYIYPDLYPLHTLEEQPKIDYEKLTEIPLPPVIQLSAERVESNGIYLMDDSETLIIFIGSRCSDQLIQKLFGYVNVNSMPELTTTLAEVDSKPSYLLRSFISYLQHFKPYPLPIEIIKDNGTNKLRFYSKLVEDKFESSLSYYEYLQRLSQQVR